MRPLPWLEYLAIGLLAAGGYLVMPGTALGNLLYLAVALSAVGANVAASRRAGVPDPRPWRLFAAGLAAFAAGDVVSYAAETGLGTAPFPSWADAFYLPAYPFLAAGLVLLLRRRNPDRDLGDLADAAILVAGAGMLAWALVITPLAGDASHPLAAKIVAVAYPLADLGLLALALRLTLVGGPAVAAGRLLGIGITASLAGDVLFGLERFSDGFRSGGVEDAFWLLTYLAFGAAALHPTARALAEPAPPAPARPPLGRVAALVGAALVGPVLLIALELDDLDPGRVVVAAASGLVFVLAILRAAGLGGRLEAALARSRVAEARFRTLVEQLPVLVYVQPVDDPHRAVYVGPQTVPLFGYEPDEWAATWSDRVHPDDRARVEAEVARTDRSGEPFRMEYRERARDGRYLWVRDEAVLVRDADGTPRYWQGVKIDIGERKRTEEALRESEERLRLIFDAVDSGIVLQDAGGAIVAANPGAARILGRSLDQLHGRSSYDPHWRTVREDGSPLPADEHPAMVALRTGEPQTGVVMGVETSDGTLRWISINARPLFRSGEAIPYAVVASFDDVTARKAAEEAMRQAKEAAEEADRAKSHFLSIATHELRTPLTSVAGYLELLLGGGVGDLSDEQREFLAIAQTSANQLTGLVNDLLDLAKIEAGRLDLAIRPVDVGTAIERTRQAVVPQASTKGIAVAVEVADGLPPAAADPDRLDQVLLNLVGNAVKFTERGGVTVSAKPVDGWVEVAVADTGIGIPAASLPHVFEAFRQADRATTRRFGGTGLGLAIAKQLVELHGGSIAAESAEGRGSTFTVRLPRAEVGGRRSAGGGRRSYSP